MVSKLENIRDFIETSLKLDVNSLIGYWIFPKSNFHHLLESWEADIIHDLKNWDQNATV